MRRRFVAAPTRVREGRPGTRTGIYWQRLQPATGLLIVLDRLPHGASMTRRAIRCRGLVAFRDDLDDPIPFSSHLPDYFSDKYDFESFSYFDYSITKNMQDALFGYWVRHPLAGKPKDRIYPEDYEDVCSGREPKPPSRWFAWKLLFRSGLVGFPLASRLAWLLDCANYQHGRLLALIARVQMERIGARLASRAAALAALTLLSGLLTDLLATPDAVSVLDDDPCCRPPPRAPGVDASGIFVPRC